MSVARWMECRRGFHVHLKRLKTQRTQRNEPLLWGITVRLPIRMDENDTSWVCLAALLDQFDTSDELIDTLLGDTATSMLVNSSARQLSPSAQNSSLDSDGTSAPPKPPSLAKRKRVRTSRPIHEIQRLRQSVQDLETLLALHKQRQIAARAAACDGDRRRDSGDSMPTGIWENVAARQFNYLREAQAENQRLRDQLLRQVGIIKSMIRLVQCAQMGLPVLPIPRSRFELDTEMIAERRRTLFSLTSEMYSVLDMVFQERPFTNVETEFREVMINHHNGEIIPPGSVLATTCVGRVVPNPVSGLADLLWNVNQSEQAAREAFKVEHRDESDYSQSFVYSVQIATPYGSTLCQGVGLRARFREEDRDVVITTGSMWPYPDTPSPLNALAYDFKEWTVVRPHIRDSTQKQVLVKFETSRPSPERALPILTIEQAAVLRFFIVQAHHFIVEQEQRRIDAILLGKVGFSVAA